MKKLSQMTKEELTKLSEEQIKQKVMQELKEIMKKNPMFISSKIDVFYSKDLK